MRILPAIILVCLASPLSVMLAGTSPEQNIQSVFSELRKLQPMLPRQSYTVQVAGQIETGPKERFLRRRTAQEVSESGLSCGCGDYALLFIERIESSGFQTLLVDGAEISLSSLRDHFSGHAVVAIRERNSDGDAPWWLVDSTNLKIISRSWSPAEYYFHAFGHIFWIGYCGPRSEYPVNGPEELKAFYTRTLEKVPPEFLDQTIHRLKFTIDPSLVGPDGKFLNPRLDAFLKLQGQLLESYQIQPMQEVPIRLTRGDDDASSDLTFSETAGWVSRVGLKSACSPSLLDYFDHAIRNRELRTAQSTK